LIFIVLTEKEYANENYGVSLRYMLKILYCQKILEIFYSVSDKSISYLLEDVFCLCSAYYNIFFKSGLFLCITYITRKKRTKEDARKEVDII